MGCDIHAFIEKRTRQRVWKYTKEIHIVRNYDLFSVLGLPCRRSADSPAAIDDLRGLPLGCSARVLKQHFDRVVHSPSWMSFLELDLFPWQKHHIDFSSALDQMRAIAEDDPTSVRLVFFFDN